jgi:hypothetical protein
VEDLFIAEQLQEYSVWLKKNGYNLRVFPRPYVHTNKVY